MAVNVLRQAKVAMPVVGTLIGICLPFYAAIFIGKSAFYPPFLLGCAAAGLLVGVLCFLVVKRALDDALAHHLETLAAATAETGVVPPQGGDLQTVLAIHITLVERSLKTLRLLAAGVTELAPRHQRMGDTSARMLRRSDEGAAIVKQLLREAERMCTSLAGTIAAIDDMARRTDERAAVCTQISAAIDSTSLRIQEYATSVVETSSSIEEIAITLRETADNVEALAESTAQTSSSVNQIAASIGHVRDSAQRSTGSAEKVRMQVQEGVAAMGETLWAMQSIEQSTDDSFGAIQRLAGHTASVGAILKVIKEVVEQTNLLSLNASIIAAQAGEHGRAFGVVAEEVRALATRTSASTREIEGLLKRIQQETVEVESKVSVAKEKVAEGARLSSRLDEALKKIDESAVESLEMVTGIARTTLEQAAGSRLISDEAEKNLSRVKQLSRALQEQERGTALVVKELEHMRELSRTIATSVRDQAEGNRQYLQGVLDDAEKARHLREEGLRQQETVEGVVQFLRGVGGNLESTAEEAGALKEEVEGASRLTERLANELGDFRRSSS